MITLLMVICSLQGAKTMIMLLMVVCLLQVASNQDYVVIDILFITRG